MSRLASMFVMSAFLGVSIGACRQAIVLGDGRSTVNEPDGASPLDASQDASRDGWTPDSEVPRFSEPVLIEALAGNEGDDDDDPSLNEALTWIFFNSTREGGAGDEDIWFSLRDSPSEPWAPPQPASALNSEARETGLALSEDGLTIYWSSDRDGGAGGLDIYTSERASLDAPWSEPLVVEALSSAGDDLISAVLEQGRLALLSRRDGDTDYHLWWARRAGRLDPWSAPEPIDELNRGGGDTDGHLARDGRQMLFSREGELQIAQRASSEAPFGEPSPLPSLNSDGEDTDPWSDRELSLIVFASDRTGDARIYEAQREPP